MGFSGQEYCNGLPFPLPGDLPDPGLKAASLKSPALTGRFLTTSATWKPFHICNMRIRMPASKSSWAWDKVRDIAGAYKCFSLSLFFKYLFIYLAPPGLSCGIAGSSIFVAAFRFFNCDMRTLSCSIWDLVSWSRMEPGPPPLGVQSLSHWTTREVPNTLLFLSFFF